MSNAFRSQISEVMCLTWQMVKRNGYSMSEALKTAWMNIKLKAAMKERIGKFYFQKVDGSIREAYGTLKDSMLPDSKGTDSCKKSDTVQTYFDTERGEFRCYKVANLVKIA